MKKINKSFNRTAEFKKDNEWGNWGEGQLIKYIQDNFKTKDKFTSYWYSSGDFSKSKAVMKSYDLRFGTYLNTDRINYVNHFDVEVKTDGFEINTGNLVFEKSSGNRKSGVFTTKAKYFIYFLPLFTTDNLYIIQPEKLIKLLNEFPEHIISGGDYGSNTLMYKIHRDDFNDKFIEAGGKLVTFTDYTIPSKFNKKQFTDTKKYVYYGDTMKKYENPLD